MAAPLAPPSLSNEAGAQRLADTSRHLAEVGAELRALSPAGPAGDGAAVIGHGSLITDQHTLMLESLRPRVERLEAGSAPPQPDTRPSPLAVRHLDGEGAMFFSQVPARATAPQAAQSRMA